MGERVVIVMDEPRVITTEDQLVVLGALAEFEWWALPMDVMFRMRQQGKALADTDTVRVILRKLTVEGYAQASRDRWLGVACYRVSEQGRYRLADWLNDDDMWDPA